ncbi:MAG: hypothetical protein N2595_05210 [bacterium]|nr:hypothetical protein [bacterium]
MKLWACLVIAGSVVLALSQPCRAQNSVYYRLFKLKPTQRGKLKAKFYYNSVEFPDILSSIVTLSFNEYTYVFNQTNDISDMFYWRRRSKLNGIYRYQRWMDKGGRVKMLINARKQWGTVDMKGVNLLALSTNRTGIHSLGLQISGMQKTERVKLVGYKHAGPMPYETNFFFVDGLTMRYNKGPADMLLIRFIAKYNAPQSLPNTVPATFVVDGQGQVSSFSGLTFTVPMTRQTKVSFAGQSGPVRTMVNFKTGKGVMVYKKQALPITLAPMQTNMVFTVRATFGAPVVFDEQTAFRAGYVRPNYFRY